MTRRNSKKFFTSLALLALLVGLGSGQAVWAESNLGLGGSATARLDFAITIPTILYLQVGTEGATVNVVSCTLADIPGTGAVAMTSSGTNPVPVRAAGFLPRGQRMTVRGNSSVPLTNGTETIRFNNIRWTATGDFTSGRFNNNANQQIRRWNGSGNRTGAYRFYYDNDAYHGSGT